MHKFFAELARLYLSSSSSSIDAIAARLAGTDSTPVSLASADGHTRAIVIPFRRTEGGNDAQHWQQLCDLANAMQGELGLPAPAVSISGVDGFGLWLSLEAPVPLAKARTFAEQLIARYLPGSGIAPGGGDVELPPCLHPKTGKWAAFIHPGLGASFADDPGLDMAPPLAGQLALLEGLQQITQAQFHKASMLMQPAGAPVSMPVTAAAPASGLLLRDATLEDIIAHLHAKNIEPTFRHLIKLQ